jgi:hypothetical protein
MSARAKAVQTLYRAKRIGIDGVKKAVTDGIIATKEFKTITGEDYTE